MFSKLDHPPVSFDDYRPFLDPTLADDFAVVAVPMGQLRVMLKNVACGAYPLAPVSTGWQTTTRTDAIAFSLGRI